MEFAPHHASIEMQILHNASQTNSSHVNVGIFGAALMLMAAAALFPLCAMPPTPTNSSRIGIFDASLVAAT